MSNFLFIVPPLTGHINPTLSIGKELLNRNHKVRWIGFDPGLEELLPEGGDFSLIPIDLTTEEREKLEEYVEELKKKSTYGIDSLKFLYEEVLTPMNTYILEGIIKLLEEHTPDLVITDHQVFAGSVAAIKTNIPYATSVTATASIKPSETFPMVYEWESEQILKFQNKNGIHGNKRLDISNLLTLVYTSELFSGIDNAPDYIKFVGPVILPRETEIDFDWEKLNSQNNNSKILVSIGTTFDHSQKKSFFEKIIEALKDENITTVIISDPSLFDNIPDHFIIQERVPQLELIPHMDLVICHGGQNTVSETLLNGIPLIITPIAYDQSYVASCVTNNNAGIRLKFNRLRASQIKEAVSSILNDINYSANAKKIQQSFKEAGGVIKAANYLEKIIV